MKADLVSFGSDTMVDFSEGDVIELNGALEAMIANEQYTATVVPSGLSIVCSIWRK